LAISWVAAVSARRRLRMAQAQYPARAETAPTVVTLPDEIDMASADRIRGDLQAAVTAGATTVVADMTATTFCDTSGIRALVLAHKHAAASGAELRLVVPSAAVLRIIGVLGLDSVLAIYPSLPDALTEPPGPKT